MIKNLPTTLWVIGATVAVAAFSPAVGQIATAPAPRPAPAAAQPTVPSTAQPSAQPGKPSAPASAQPSNAPSVEVTVQPSGEPSGQPAAGVVVKTGRTELGPTAVDAEGYTLYLSVLDSTDPPRSVCLSRQCLTAWLPVYLPKGASAVAGAGVEQSSLGAVRRPDGTRQVTLGGWPLYRYYADRAPGDVRGEGLKGTWHAVGPDGKKAAG